MPPVHALHQHDGLTNPDNFVAHRQLLLAFVRHFGVLAATYRVTGDERYAAAAEMHPELAHTKPYGYSIFNLDVMTGLAAALSTPNDKLLPSPCPTAAAS